MMPLPPTNREKPGELNEDETSHILNVTLKERHREDPDVLAFIDSFIRCRDIRQASVESGMAPSVGRKLRYRRDIALAIQKLTDRSAVKHGIDGSEIFERVKEVVEFDPILLMNPDGTFKSNLHDIPPEARRVLKKMKVKNLWGETEDINGMKSKIVIGEVIEYEFYDKLKSAELIGKEKQMFKNTTVHEHTVTKDMAEVLLASKKRAEAVTAPQPVTIEAEVIKDENSNT